MCVVVRTHPTSPTDLLFALIPDSGSDAYVVVSRDDFGAAIHQVACLILMGAMTTAWTYQTT